MISNEKGPPTDEVKEPLCNFSPFSRALGKLTCHGRSECDGGRGFRTDATKTLTLSLAPNTQMRDPLTRHIQLFLNGKDTNKKMEFSGAPVEVRLYKPCQPWRAPSSASQMFSAA